MRTGTRALVCAALGAAVLAGLTATALAKEYTVSTKWKGKADGQTDGNPLVVDGKALWRADGLVNADPTNIDSYKPLSWSTKQKRWAATGAPGAANAAYVPDNVQLGGAGPEGDKPGQRVGVLVFIAPHDGTYALAGQANVRVWRGRACEKIMVVKLDRADKKVTEVASLKVELDEEGKPKPVDLSGVRADLKAGQELAIFLYGQKPNGGCNAVLEGFKVVEGAAPPSTQPATQPAD